MEYNTLIFKKDRLNPYSKPTINHFLTPSEQISFSNNFRTRQQTVEVSWNGGKTYNWYELDSMIEIKLFLSNNKAEYRFII
jgi:hypothetical protein